METKVQLTGKHKSGLNAYAMTFNEEPFKKYSKEMIVNTMIKELKANNIEATENDITIEEKIIEEDSQNE